MKLKIIILSTMIILLLIPFMAVAEVCEQNNLTIESIKLEDKSNKVEELNEAIINGDSINLNLSMIEVGDSIEYKLVVNNNLNEDYEIVKTNFNTNSDYISYTIKSDDNSNIVKSKSNKTIYLKIKYINEIPNELFEFGKYDYTKTVTINLLNTNKSLNNPNTMQSSIYIFILILIISSTTYIYFRKKKNLKFIVLVLGITIIIPISVYALCSYNIKIESIIRINKLEKCTSFDEDSWDTISRNIKNKNTDCYHVGDTKEIDMGNFGTHILRIANKSTPAECSNSEFSQTACGFVLEFADIVTKHEMNSYPTTIGGWPETLMRTYLNSDIYNALPEVLRNTIIDTNVISGYGYVYNESNYTSTDKLYLLSSLEVWGSLMYDTVDSVQTRQLDYYASIGTTSSNTSGAIKKFNNVYSAWWLRGIDNSAYRDRCFSVIAANGTAYLQYADSSSFAGASPAFRVD